MKPLALTLIITAALGCYAAEIKAPDRVVAGNQAVLTTSGSGDAILYLIGPGHVAKRQVRLGEEIKLSADELQKAGRYVAVIRSGSQNSAAAFWVVAGPAANINFLARPSRVPTARQDVISGVAFVFDQYNNLVLAPTQVKFDLSVTGAAPQSRTVPAKYGVAWTRMNSDRKEGAAQFVASVNGANVRRVVQQVAADPCNLHMRAQPSKTGILVETDPVRDCSGNAVPDGTIVTFTEVDERGKSTVDARIKRGIARAELPRADRATISVAAGVVVGNEIRWGGGR